MKENTLLKGFDTGTFMLESILLWWAARKFPEINQELMIILICRAQLFCHN